MDFHGLQVAVEQRIRQPGRAHGPRKVLLTAGTPDPQSSRSDPLQSDWCSLAPLPPNPALPNGQSQHHTHTHPYSASYPRLPALEVRRWSSDFLSWDFMMASCLCFSSRSLARTSSSAHTSGGKGGHERRGRQSSQLPEADGTCCTLLPRYAGLPSACHLLGPQLPKCAREVAKVANEASWRKPPIPTPGAGLRGAQGFSLHTCQESCIIFCLCSAAFLS